MSAQGAVLFLSALLLAALCLMPQACEFFPIWLASAALRLADVMFHEMGHALTHWALGHPSIPAILTAFGSDQASGVALTFGYNWFLQGCVWLGMAYHVWWLRDTDHPVLSKAMGALYLLLFAASWWTRIEVLPVYMGHGAAILMGSFFLYRGLLDLSARSVAERWLNLLLGLFLLGHNLVFAWKLAFDAAARSVYSDMEIFGAGHHDFMAMHDAWPALTVEGIAVATVVFVVALTLATMLCAYIRRYDYEE